ncbi:MAG TPA: peptidyl-prolyl cis-trans isomerase [Fimbriimonadaceae bacterium]|nr:peptidyl-prolyl cis-trans isomerase [Fimbriimonadaceae bacterium]
MRPQAVIALAALAVAAHAQVDPDRVVVKVNGHPILGREYYSRMEIQPGLGSVDTDGRFVQVYPGYLALRWLIEEELIIQLAKEQGVAPTQKDVDDEYATRLKLHPEQYKAMIQLGFTEADLKRKVLVDLSDFNIVTKGVTVTDFEVEKQYKDNLARLYTLPKRYQLRMVLVQSEDDKKPVDDAIAAGDKFEDVASKFSIDLTKLNGGKIGTISEGDLIPASRTAIASTKKGQVTPWVEQNGKFARFQVEDILEPKILPLDDALKREIRDDLMKDRGAAKNNILQLMEDFRKKAVLEFGNFPFADDIKQFFGRGG